MYDIQIIIASCTKATYFARRVEGILDELLPEDTYHTTVTMTDRELTGVNEELVKTLDLGCRCIPAFCRGCAFMPPPGEDDPAYFLPVVLVDRQPVLHSRIRKTADIYDALREFFHEAL